MNEEVVGTGDEVDVECFFERGDLLAEFVDSSSGIGLQADRDHRLDTLPERLGIDFRVESSNDTALYERSHASESGGRRDSGGRSQRVVGQPGVASEFVDQNMVDVIERLMANIVRNTSRRRSLR